MHSAHSLDDMMMEATQQFVSQTQGATEAVKTKSVKVETLQEACAEKIELCFSDARYTVLHNLHLHVEDDELTIKHLVLDCETHHVILFDELNQANALRIDELGHFLIQAKASSAFQVLKSPIERLVRYQQLLMDFLKSLGYVCGSMDYFVLVGDTVQFDKPLKGFEHVCYLRELDDQVHCQKKGICGALRLLKSGIRNKWNAKHHNSSEISAFMSTLQSQP